MIGSGLRGRFAFVCAILPEENTIATPLSALNVIYLSAVPFGI
jgi:hypothetical protein